MTGEGHDDVGVVVEGAPQRRRAVRPIPTVARRQTTIALEEGMRDHDDVVVRMVGHDLPRPVDDRCARPQFEAQHQPVQAAGSEGAPPVVGLAGFEHAVETEACRGVVGVPRRGVAHRHAGVLAWAGAATGAHGRGVVVARREDRRDTRRLEGPYPLTHRRVLGMVGGVPVVHVTAVEDPLQVEALAVVHQPLDALLHPHLAREHLVLRVRHHGERERRVSAGSSGGGDGWRRGVVSCLDCDG